MFLTSEELTALTGMLRGPAQRRVLNAMGIAHRVRPDGKVIVLRAVVEEDMGVKRKMVESEPNWAAIR